jgi:glycerol-3-phosphate cytidylyltransferase
MPRIGYTTGVFDLFHVGHLNILRNAKLECDYLIVGVTTDELCIKEKRKIPVIPFLERIEIVQAIRYVDCVVPQNSYDKLKAWEDLKFNMMFVGDDWKGTDKWNALEQEFNELGVIIHYFPYTANTSSTKIRKIIDTFDE